MKYLLQSREQFAKKPVKRKIKSKQFQLKSCNEDNREKFDNFSLKKTGVNNIENTTPEKQTF